MTLIYVFHGEDDFSASEALRPLIEAVGSPDMRDSNVSQLDASGFTVEKFGAAAMVVPFLAERRLVVVRGLLAMAEGQRTGRRGRRTKADDEGPAAGLPALLTQLPPTTDVVFIDGKLAPSNPLLAALRELGNDAVKVRQFPPLNGDALASWVRERATMKGAGIEGQAVAALVELVGGNLWAMNGEIEKLAIYAGDRPIALDDVRALGSGNRDANIFELVDAIMDKRPNVALELTNRLLHTGAAGPYIITMIARQARLVAIAQDLAARKVPPPEWPSRMGTTSDFVVRKTSEQARRFTPEAVRGLYRLILEADMAIKTGESSDDLALAELIARAGTLHAAPRPAGRGR